MGEAKNRKHEIEALKARGKKSNQTTLPTIFKSALIGQMKQESKENFAKVFTGGSARLYYNELGLFTINNGKFAVHAINDFICFTDLEHQFDIGGVMNCTTTSWKDEFAVKWLEMFAKEQGYSSLEAA